MPIWIISILTIVIFVTIILLGYYYEDIVIPAVCFGAAIFFIYCSIVSGVYFMLIVPVGCIIYGIIHIKDHPIHKKPPKEDKK